MTAAYRLLVCDDEEDFRDYVRQVAEAMDYEVTQVADSRECVAAVAALVPDVIVLDIVMPEVDGIEIVQRLTAAGFRGKVVLTSGFNPHYARSAEILARTKGMTVQTLLKPVPMASLQAALR